MSYVTYEGQKYYVEDGRLDFGFIEIREILEIEGLDTLTNLKSLNLHGNQISEIKGLETLVKLITLTLSNNNISDIKGLEMLTNLQWLNLGTNKISEIKGLKTLTNLQWLHLGINKISEIKGFEQLIDLRELNLEYNSISEIKGLGMNTNLEILSLFGNQISEIKGLETLINLQELKLNNNQISEIKGLETLTNLQELILNNNQISEIKGLETLTKLQKLYLKKNPINKKEYYLIDQEAQEVVAYCKEENKDFKEKREKIVETKRKIQNLIFNDEKNRCILSNNIFHRCGKLNAIDETINIPKILGLFMYEFPKPTQEYSEHKEFYENYHEEINRLRQFFQNFNESNDFIEIKLPEEATDTLVKTCSFCQIARSYDFGILLMTPPNPNAFLEAGMFMSLGKRVIFLNNDLYPVKPPFDATSYFYIHYDNLNKIEERWSKKMPRFFDELLKNYLENIDYTSNNETDIDDLEDLTKFYKMISHEIEFTKGELISIVNQIGNDKFNKYLNMELQRKASGFGIISKKWQLLIFRPGLLTPFNFKIYDRELKENSSYQDNPEDYGNIEIYNQLISYIKNSLTKVLSYET